MGTPSNRYHEYGCRCQDCVDNQPIDWEERALKAEAENELLKLIIVNTENQLIVVAKKLELDLLEYEQKQG